MVAQTIVDENAQTITIITEQGNVATRSYSGSVGESDYCYALEHATAEALSKD